MVRNTLIASILLPGVAIAALSLPASAQQQGKQAKPPAYAKSLSYDEAWARCKKFVDEGVASWDQTSQRYARGAACMKKYGHRI